jgi:magnesium transporter
VFTALLAYDDREAAVEVFQRLDAFALPVVDRDGILLGIVTADDVIDVAQEEATEDIQLTAGLAPLGVSYHDASVWTLYNRRIGWLAGLVVVYVVAARLMAGFEATLSGAIALAFFIPLVIGSAGNAGSQSAMLLVRAIATGDVEKGRWKRAVAKEMGVSVLLGASLALLGGVLGLHQAGIKLAFVVAASMLILVVVAIFVGAGLPLLLSRYRLDPAMASSPLITTITDSAGLVVYLAVATWMLGL